MRGATTLTWIMLLAACEPAAPPPAPAARKAMLSLSFEEARRLPPMDLSDMSPWRTTLAAGWRGFCRVRQESVECWGAAYGSRPRRIEGIDEALEIVVRGARGCALRRGGRLTCWVGDGAIEPGERPLALPLIERSLPGAVDWEESCAIDAEGRARCFVLCDEDGRCFRRFEEQSWHPTEVAIASPHPQCGCVLTRSGALTCAGPWCEEWTGQDGARSHVLEGMSGTMLFHGLFEICVSRGDGRLLCRGGHTIAPGTPDRRNAIRTHTQVVPLPPGLSPPVRAVRLTDWMCLVHEEGELSCRHLWEPLEQVRDLPGPVRQLAGWGGTVCLELASGDVTCRAGSLMLQLRSKLSHVPWVTVPPSLP